MKIALFYSFNSNHTSRIAKMIIEAIGKKAGGMGSYQPIGMNLSLQLKKIVLKEKPLPFMVPAIKNLIRIILLMPLVLWPISLHIEAEK